MYDLIMEEALGSDLLPRPLDSYEVLILSNLNKLDAYSASLVDNYVSNGGRLLVTGFPGISSGTSLKCLGIKSEPQLYPRSRSTYLKVDEIDKSTLGQEEFQDFDVIMMNSDFLNSS